MNSGTLNDNHKHKMLAVEERYSPINLNDSVNIINDYGVLNNNDSVDGFPENIKFHGYVCNIQMDELTHQENNINVNGNGSYHVVPNVPINLMPPPPHIVNNIRANVLDGFTRRGSWKSRGELRSNSPHDSESDESCQSFTSRDSPSDNGVRQKMARNTCPSFYASNLLYSKYSSSSPSVFFCTTPSQTNQQAQTNPKVRYYINSCNNQKRDGKRRQPHDIYCRVYGLMERFTSRAPLLHITAKPPNLNTHDHLSQSIWDVFCAKAQKEDIYIRKLQLWKLVYLHIRKILLRYGLFMVGSTMSGLGTEKSDIDMCLLVKPCLNDARSDALSYLQNIQLILQNCDFIVNPEVILAKVPILKFKDSRYGFEVDLNCNNAVGIRNTHLLHCYAYLDWRVRPLVIVVKLWAQANDINDAKRMTISSYSLALMVIHFLQCGVTPPAVPCLHGLYPNKFSPNSVIHNIDIQEELPPFYSDNKQTLGELFLGFLHYYSVFDYDRYAISVREGSVLFKEECRYTRSQKNDVTQWKLLCIEEPFDLTNTARSVYNVDTFEHIKHVFQFSYKTLNETKNLNSILPSILCEGNQR